MDCEPQETALRAAIDVPAGGQCLMAGFPGLETGIDGTPYIDPDSLHATLAQIRAHGARLLVVLTEEQELPENAYQFLRDGSAVVGLDLVFLPIRDFSVPDADGLRQWQNLKTARADMPARGGTIAFCCQYGAGRSGLMVALCLMEQGVPLERAVATIRDQFAEAIESKEQMAWLDKVSSRLKDETQGLDPN